MGIVGGQLALEKCLGLECRGFVWVSLILSEGGREGGIEKEKEGYACRKGTTRGRKKRKNVRSSNLNELEAGHRGYCLKSNENGIERRRKGNEKVGEKAATVRVNRQKVAAVSRIGGRSAATQTQPHVAD